MESTEEYAMSLLLASEGGSRIGSHHRRGGQPDVPILEVDTRARIGIGSFGR